MQTKQLWNGVWYLYTVEHCSAYQVFTVYITGTKYQTHRSGVYCVYRETTLFFI